MKTALVLVSSLVSAFCDRQYFEFVYRNRYQERIGRIGSSLVALSLSWDTYWHMTSNSEHWVPEGSDCFLKVISSSCCGFFVILPVIMQACTSSSLSFGMTTCCAISSHFVVFTLKTFYLYSLSNQISDIYAQVSFINFCLLSSGTPLHTSSLQTLHFTDVLAVAAHRFCSWGNIIDLRFIWVFPDVVAVRVSGRCTNGNCGVLTDNASFVKQVWQMSIGAFTFHNNHLAERVNIYSTLPKCIETGFLVGNGKTASLLGKLLFFKSHW